MKDLIELKPVHVERKKEGWIREEKYVLYKPKKKGIKFQLYKTVLDKEGNYVLDLGEEGSQKIVSVPSNKFICLEEGKYNRFSEKGREFLNKIIKLYEKKLEKFEIDIDHAWQGKENRGVCVDFGYWFRKELEKLDGELLYGDIKLYRKESKSPFSPEEMKKLKEKFGLERYSHDFTLIVEPETGAWILLPSATRDEELIKGYENWGIIEKKFEVSVYGSSN